MKYSIVIPTYNHCDDLLKPCVESIFKFSRINDIELIISANGCKDNTLEYITSLKEKLNYLGLGENLKVAWADEALGYAKACNEGIRLATTDLIVLLNNDTFLMEQQKNQWLEILAAPFNSPKCGISCIIKSFSEPAGRDFAIFFCVMIHKKVFDKIGLLPLDYGVGGGEDTEFSIECERAGFDVVEAIEKHWSDEVSMYAGGFPIYHKGEGTMHDADLVPEWQKIFDENSLILAKKYNPAWYAANASKILKKPSLPNDMFIRKGQQVPLNKQAMYRFAAQNTLGSTILEIGCSSGFGAQFFNDTVSYTGIDIENDAIDIAKVQNWLPNCNFYAGEIGAMLYHRDPLLSYYDTIIAFDLINYLDNGFEVCEQLKEHCDRLFVTVPYNENPGQFNPKHRLHNLTSSKFAGFVELGLLNSNGNLILDRSQLGPEQEYFMVLYWDSRIKGKGKYRSELDWLATQDLEVFNEVIRDNAYRIKPDDFANGEVAIDVGANNGTFAILAAYMGASKVIAIEPAVGTYQQLTGNVIRSRLPNIVTKKNIVHSTAGVKEKIYLESKASHNSLYAESGAFEEVETITLTELLSEAGKNDVILKLDCEGAEYDILLNMLPEQMSKVKAIVLEIHADAHPKFKGFELITEKLQSFGLRCIEVKQWYSWIVGPNGQPLEVKPMPCRVDVWRR